MPITMCTVPPAIGCMWQSAPTSQQRFITMWLLQSQLKVRGPFTLIQLTLMKVRFDSVHEASVNGTTVDIDTACAAYWSLAIFLNLTLTTVLQRLRRNLFKMHIIVLHSCMQANSADTLCSGCTPCHTFACHAIFSLSFSLSQHSILSAQTYTQWRLRQTIHLPDV